MSLKSRTMIYQHFPIPCRAQRDRAEVVVNIASNLCLSTKFITQCHKHDRKSTEYGQSVQNSNTDSLPHLLKENNGEIQRLYGSQLSGEAIPRV